MQYLPSPPQAIWECALPTAETPLAVLDGLGVAHLFESQVQEHVSSGRLVKVLEDRCPTYPGYYLYYPRRRQMPAALRVFIDYVSKSTSTNFDLCRS